MSMARTKSICTPSKGHQMDSAFSWFVLGCCFFSLTFVNTGSWSAGMLQADIVSDLQVGSGPVSVMTSLTISMSCILGPLSGIMCSLLSVRVAVSIGAILYALGMVGASLSYSLEAMIFWFGCLSGLGFGISYSPVIMVLTFYFEKNLLKATNILMCSNGLGCIFLPYLYQYLLDDHGWRMCMSVVACIILQTIVLFAFLKPTPVERKTMITLASIRHWLKRKARRDVDKSCTDQAELRQRLTQERSSNNDGPSGQTLDNEHCTSKMIGDVQNQNKDIQKSSDDLKDRPEPKKSDKDLYDSVSRANCLPNYTQTFIEKEGPNVITESMILKHYTQINGISSSEIFDLDTKQNAANDARFTSNDVPMNTMSSENGQEKINAHALVQSAPERKVANGLQQACSSEIHEERIEHEHQDFTPGRGKNTETPEVKCLYQSEQCQTAVPIEDAIISSPSPRLRPRLGSQSKHSLASSLMFASHSEFGSSVLVSAAAISFTGLDLEDKTSGTMSLLSRMKCVWRHKGTWLLCVNAYLAICPWAINLVHFPSFVASVGVPGHWVSHFYSLEGLAILGGGLAGSYLYQRLEPPLLVMLFVTQVIHALAVGLAPFYATSVPGLFVLQCLVGLMYFQFYMLYSPIIAKMVGIDLLTLAFGQMHLFAGLSFLLSPIMAGYMYDFTGSFHLPYHAGGCCGIGGALLVILIRYIEPGVSSTGQVLEVDEEETKTNNSLRKNPLAT